MGKRGQQKAAATGKLSLFFISVESYHTDNDRTKTENFTDDCTDREVGNIVNKPYGGADKSEFSYGFCICQAITVGCCNHTDYGKDFNNEVLQCRFCFENGESQYV